MSGGKLCSEVLHARSAQPPGAEGVEAAHEAAGAAAAGDALGAGAAAADGVDVPRMAAARSS
jgi:hypothetical protein